jgi:hypothetical protein
MEPIFARFAERYAKQGFPVFPLLPNCKKPIYGSKEGQNTGGFHHATTNLSTVRCWATLHPTANIGIRTGEEGGFSAIDIDPKNYGFEQALKRLEDRLVHKRRPGRNAELYTVTCFMAPYVRGGFISEATVRSAFEDASKRNGLVAENGIKDVRNTIDDAFRLSTDGLPDLSKLEDRPLERRAAA